MNDQYTILRDYTTLPTDLFPIIIDYTGEVKYNKLAKYIINLITDIKGEWINSDMTYRVIWIIDTTIELNMNIIEKKEYNLLADYLYKEITSTFLKAF